MFHGMETKISFELNETIVQEYYIDKQILETNM